MLVLSCTAMGQPASPPAPQRGTGGGSTNGSPGAGDFSRLWFDPTQLPAFTGVVERYLMDPEGKIERLLFREGPQVILPPPVGDEVEKAVEPGRSIIVWGIRARRAPVITMLAWATDSNAQPNFVERPRWGIPGFNAGSQTIEVSGDVQAPLYTPQGDPMGAILQDGMVIRLPPDVAAAMGGRLSPGSKLAASGQGTAGPLGRSLDADRIGDSLATLGPLPRPAEKRP
ncbi:hypothetical protein LPC08_08185 [Roseomonas sp. OT10]|uniref:hypothetical protein n=1 Tax=Roseomonas cutis TaxID=2897332 RepID=UPI001E35B1D4|nr:hypothetical protein [Roseomonas sp. OT10]UFN50581.1 hypothetical protein LPC08_08185 [Roseomonas sp. OT10]